MSDIKVLKVLSKGNYNYVYYNEVITKKNYTKYLLNKELIAKLTDDISFIKMTYKEAISDLSLAIPENVLKAVKDE